MDMDIFAELEKLNLPLGEYIVLGSGILGALGIREIGDIDLLVTPNVFESLKKEGWEYQIVEYDGRPREKLSKDDTEVFKDFWYGDQKPDPTRMTAGAVMINGFPFLSLEKLRSIKVAFNREKDQSDIALIDTYLAQHTHNMCLHPAPFEKIKAGTKVIEVRLNDEKRKDLRVADVIIFENRATGETLKTTVTALHHFPTFKALYEHFPPQMYGSEKSDEWNQMYKYYSAEDEQKYGVLSIELQVVH